MTIFLKKRKCTSLPILALEKKNNIRTSSFYKINKKIINMRYPYYYNIRHHLNYRFSSYKNYDPIKNCKSAGIIPYTFINGEVKFLLQKNINSCRKKDLGWNDFGGKRSKRFDNSIKTASREFSEETSCLFYLKDFVTNESEKLYNLYKENKDLYYDNNTIENLKKTIQESQKFYTKILSEKKTPLYASSKEIYITYFVNVKYIPEEDIPRAEDIHISYETRYIRICKWFSFKDIMEISELDFHKRLQMIKIQRRLQKYCNDGLFCALSIKS